MKKIKEYRMSLMEKDSKNPAKEEGKVNYMIRNTAILEVEKFIETQNLGVLDDESYNNIVFESSNLLYEELLKHKGEHQIDSVGVWVTFTDGQEIDNSIDLSVLEDLKEYGTEDVNPVLEFFKMTVGAYESQKT